MTYELLTAVLILALLFVIFLEYVWLYIMANRQENKTDKLNASKKRIDILVKGVLYSPSEEVCEKELSALKELVGDDPVLFEVTDEILTDTEKRIETLPDGTADMINRIYAAIDPVALFSKLLEKGNVYEKGYACRRLSDFDCYDYLEDMRKLSKEKNRTLSYNAAMALARLGDTEGVADYILKIEDDKKYSGRIINEFFAHFSMDRGELAERIFEDCNDYMKCTVIKAISKYGLNRFEELYRAGCISKNKDMRIASVKALGILGNPENEHILIVASKDREWVVRLAAVSGLERLKTPGAAQAVEAALGDKEWWVRQAAANALVNMDVSIDKLNEIIKGYDRYASDAMKYALYKTVDLRD